MNKDIEKLEKSIRRWLIFFIVSLVISGLTAVDVENGIWWLSSMLSPGFIHDWVIRYYRP